jgi:putative transcriptional regulator
MGQRKLRIADVSRSTGLNRSTLSALYWETTTRVDLATIEQLCRLLDCEVGELFEHIREADGAQP